MDVDEQDLAMWVILYSSVVGFNAHPGNRSPKSKVELAAEADEMFQQYLLRKAGGIPWVS